MTTGPWCTDVVEIRSRNPPTRHPGRASRKCGPLGGHVASSRLATVVRRRSHGEASLRGSTTNPSPLETALNVLEGWSLLALIAPLPDIESEEPKRRQRPQEKMRGKGDGHCL